MVLADVTTKDQKGTLAPVAEEDEKYVPDSRFGAPDHADNAALVALAEYAIAIVKLQVHGGGIDTDAFGPHCDPDVPRCVVAFALKVMAWKPDGNPPVSTRLATLYMRVLFEVAIARRQHYVDEAKRIGAVIARPESKAGNKRTRRRRRARRSLLMVVAPYEASQKVLGMVDRMVMCMNTPMVNGAQGITELCQIIGVVTALIGNVSFADRPSESTISEGITATVEKNAAEERGAADDEVEEELKRAPEDPEVETEAEAETGEEI